MKIETYGTRLNLLNRFKGLFKPKKDYVLLTEQIDLYKYDLDEEEE